MPSSKDMPSKAGAIIIGLVELGIFCVCALFGLLMLVIPKTTPGMEGQQVGIAASFYFLIGLLFLVFGLGTMLGKRWARTLMLIISWFWFIAGIVSLSNLIFMMPSFDKTLEASGQANPGLIATMKVVMFVIFFVFFVLLPGLFILFYGREKAKKNFETWDQKESWTDHCPAPVLAMSLCSGLGALFMTLLMPFYHFVMPVFGFFVDGWSGAFVYLVIGGALVYAAWGSYRLKMTAWWTLLGVYLFWGVSSVWTFSLHSMLEMEEKMGMPQATIDQAKKMGMFDDKSYWAVYMGILFALYVGYLFFIRKYFKAEGKKSRKR